MRALVPLAVVVVLAAVPASLANAPRVEQEPYFAGPGDVDCALFGLGCQAFYVWGGETQVDLAVHDDVRPDVGADACVNNCTSSEVNFCDGATLTGLHGGDRVIVFIGEARGLLYCPWPYLAVGVKGTITATFT